LTAFRARTGARTRRASPAFLTWATRMVEPSRRRHAGLHAPSGVQTSSHQGEKVGQRQHRVNAVLKCVDASSFLHRRCSYRQRRLQPICNPDAHGGRWKSSVAREPARQEVPASRIAPRRSPVRVRLAP
jgi:hypothetical protein